MPRKTESTTPAAGHNSIDRAKLKELVDRIESIEAERAELASDIRDVYAEAKGCGLDVKALRAVIRLRKQDREERDERQAIVDSYLEALGMLVGTPLGDHAIARASQMMPPV